ncbi:MAG: ZIP family metal transporter [Lishizhenia sp.]
MSTLFILISLIGSVFLGAAIVTVLNGRSQDKTIKLLLSFGGGFLLSIAFIHFIPEIYSKHDYNIGFYILIGFLIQLFLEYFSGGIEHGHVHPTKNGTLPWGLFISLSLHSFIEGIPLAQETIEGAESVINHVHSHSHTHHHSGEDNTLLLGIILHKIPVAVALMTMLFASGFNRTKSWMVILGFSIMAPLGFVFGQYGFSELSLNIDLVLAVVVGMFLHISTTIIFESSENHKFNFAKLISLLIGVILALLVH